jgi:hypothetical protein
MTRLRGAGDTDADRVVAVVRPVVVAVDRAHVRIVVVERGATENPTLGKRPTEEAVLANNRPRSSGIGTAGQAGPAPATTLRPGQPISRLALTAGHDVRVVTVVTTFAALRRPSPGFSA